MKNKIISFTCMLLCLICFSFGISACGVNDNADKDNSNKDNQATDTTISANTLVFGYGVDKVELTNYFVDNGTKSNVLKGEYCINNNLATIYYYPQENKLSVMRQIVSNSTLSNAGYTYKWTCAFSIKLYDLFSNAVWTGLYEHTAINLNTLNVRAEYTANFKFNISKFAKTNELADFTLNSFNSSITYADNYASANRMFEPEQEGQKIYLQFQSCFNAVDIIFKKINSDTDLSSVYNATNYQSIDFSQTVLDSDSCNFDNETHSIYAKNIPNNVLVEYNGNNQSNVGNYTVTATFTDPQGNVLHTLSANIEITDIFNITVEYIYGNIVSVNGERGLVVGTQKFKATYNSDILEYCKFPKGFVWKDTSNNWQSFLRDDYTWKGYGDQTFSVSVAPEYEGYVQVSSNTNSNINGAIIEYSVLQKTYENNIQSAKLYGSENLVAFKPSDIQSIKIFNTATLSSIDGTYYTNLETIDLSDCTHLKSINEGEYGLGGFFNNCQNLKSVIAPNLPNLKIIGKYFLSNTNIINFNFDMSAVEEIGDNFLYNSLYGEEIRTINIDLKNISKISLSNFLGSKNYTNSPTINLYLYDYKISNVWFDKNARCNIYVSSQLDYFNSLFEDYPNIHFYELSRK